MINIIIFSCVCLTAALFLMGFICFNVLKLNAQSNELNQKLIQLDSGIQLVEKRISSLETKLDEHFEAIKTMRKAPAFNTRFF